MVEINAMWPLDDIDGKAPERHWEIFSVAQTLELATFFAWLWLFSFKYFTVSREIRYMFDSER